MPFLYRGEALRAPGTPVLTRVRVSRPAIRQRADDMVPWVVPLHPNTFCRAHRRRLSRVVMAAAWLLALLVVHEPWARAEGAQVVLADVPEELEQATRTTLASWNLRVISVSASLPPDVAPAMQRARALAAQHGAGAVVWLASTPDGHALWLYDVHHEQLVSRPLPAGPPFDEPTAASVALSIKTLLRHSTVAPAEERIDPAGAHHGGSQRGGGAHHGGSQHGDAQHRDAHRGDAQHRDTSEDGARSSPDAGASAGPPLLPFEAWAQIRSTELVEREIEPRFRVGLAWWPGSLEHRYGMAVHFETGPASPVKPEGARADFLDMALALELRRRIQLPARFYAVASGGVGLHFTRLDGVVTGGSGRVHQHKIDPSLDIGLQVGATLKKNSGVDLAIRAFASTRWQEHVIDGSTVLESPVFDLGMGVGLIIELN